MIGERVLAALTLAAALAAAALERAAPLPRAVRQGLPWTAVIEARPPAGATQIIRADYDAAAQRLVLLHCPDATVAPPAEERLDLALPALPAGSEPAAEAARALRAASRSPRALLRALGLGFTGLVRSRPARFDEFFFLLELRHLPRGGILAARLAPGESADARLALLVAAPAAAPRTRAATVEILAGAESPGLASAASKMLKSAGLDVLATASSPPRARTVVYARDGDEAAAADAARALDCPSAEAVDSPDASRAADVSVALGGDCVPFVERAPRPRR